MADPTNPLPNASDLNNAATATDQVTKSMDAMNSSIINSNINLGEMTGLAANAGEIFNSMNSYIRSLGVSINNVGALTAKQSTQFSMLTNFVVGAKEAYNNLANVDSGNLNTFSSQVDGLLEILNKKGTAPDVAASALGGLRDMWIKSGNSVSDFDKAASKGTDTLSAFMRSTLTAADNALKLQNAYLQLSAKTGNLNTIFNAAGPTLNGINDLLLKQSVMMTDTAAATGVEIAQVQKYYSELGIVPGALESMVTSGGSANKTVNMLTASIKLATGTGRAYSDVIDDLKVAYKDYNLTGEPALQFTARISEISNKFGINLDVVRDSLKNTAGMFKMFGNEGEASAKILNDYIGALKSTGLSGDAATEVVTNMTSSIKDMSIAQKSFLSIQTGGAGGLMGGFQIEKMMREGKMDEVFEKMRQQMTKQFGKIVTLDEASKSQGAAQQMERQILLLKQGPLGSVAKDDQTAMRILEGFRAKQEGKVVPGELSNRIVQDSINKGTVVEEKSYTELVKIRSAIDRSRGVAETGSLGFLQKSFTVGQGKRYEDNELSSSQIKNKENTQTFMRESGESVKQVTAKPGEMPILGATKNLAETQSVNAIKQFESVISDLPDAFRSPIDAIKNMFEGNKKIDEKAELQKIKDEIAREKKSAVGLNGTERKDYFEKTRQEENLYSTLKKQFSNMEKPSQTTNTLINMRAPEDMRNVTSGAVIGKTVAQTSSKKNITKETETESVATKNKTEHMNHPQEVTVHVLVSDDRVTYKVGSQAAANNVASRQ